MILTAAFRPSLAAFRLPGGAASPARTASVASRVAAPSASAASATSVASAVSAAPRASAADSDLVSEPAAERGWFESSRELLAGLTVIELAGPAAAAALQ